MKKSLFLLFSVLFSSCFMMENVSGGNFIETLTVSADKTVFSENDGCTVVLTGFLDDVYKNAEYYIEVATSSDEKTVPFFCYEPESDKTVRCTEIENYKFELNNNSAVKINLSRKITGLPKGSYAISLFLYATNTKTKSKDHFYETFHIEVE